MLIAQSLRKTNIAEYILYLWQIEDLLRTCKFDSQLIDQQLVQRFKADEETSKLILDWYMNLALMMEKEHIQAKGHLQVLKNLVNDLNEFHQKMLEIQKDQKYVGLYRATHMVVAEFMQRSDMETENEVEACLTAMYGVMLLKLKNTELSAETVQTIEGFSRMIGHLSARYIQFENDEFDFDMNLSNSDADGI